MANRDLMAHALFEAYKLGVIGAGVEIEDTWNNIEDCDRAGWIAVADLVVNTRHLTCPPLSEKKE